MTYEGPARVTCMHTSEARGTGMAITYGLLLFPIGYALAPSLGLSGFSGRVIGGFVGSAIAAAVIKGATMFTTGAAGSSAAFLSGSTRRDATADVPLSLVEAAIARGDHALATTLFDELTTVHPSDRGVLRAAAQYHARHGEAEQASALLRRLRSAVPDEELYATQRLVDLYLERVREPARALPELRRIVERYPGSPEAAGAERALRELREAGAVALS